MQNKFPKVPPTKPPNSWYKYTRQWGNSVENKIIELTSQMEGTRHD